MSQRHTKMPSRNQLVMRTDSQDRPKQATARKNHPSKREKQRQYGYSSVLFAESSFLTGMARLFDFTGSLSSRLDGLTPAEIDRLALYADHRAVLEDHQGARQQMKQRGLWEDVVA